jgi:hypothetical protein
MKSIVWLCCILWLLPAFLTAQKNDSIHLVCPLDGAIIVPPAHGVIHFDDTDFCMYLASITDTSVKAAANGRITNVVQSTEDSGRWEIVFFTKFQNKEYYFWYTGITKAMVKRNDIVKAGQSIGAVKPGQRIELMMYDFETPVNPAKYLDCNGPKQPGK